MPSFPSHHRRRSSLPSSSKPALNKAAIIGGTIGAVYALILLLVIYFLLRRRRKQRTLKEQEQEKETHATLYVGFNDYFDTSPRSRSLQQDHRPPTRRFVHRRTASEGDETSTSNMRGASSNPFWMFDGTYEETEIGTIHHHFRRRSESSLLSSVQGSVIRHRRPTTGSSGYTSTQRMPTEIFVEEMNARYPQVSSIRPQGSTSKFSPLIRQVPRSPSPSSSFVTTLRSTTTATTTRAQVVDGYLPPIPIHPLMHKDSIDRIVSGVVKREEKEKEGEIVRMGTVRRVRSRRIVHVRHHKKSLSALSERVLKRIRKSQKGKGKGKERDEGEEA